MRLITGLLLFAQGTHQFVMPPRAVEPDHVGSKAESAAQRALLYLPGSDYDRALVDACVAVLVDPYASSRASPQFLENCIARLSLFATPSPQDVEFPSEASSEASSEKAAGAASLETYYISIPLPTVSEAVASTFPFSVDLSTIDKNRKGTLEVKYS